MRTQAFEEKFKEILKFIDVKDYALYLFINGMEWIVSVLWFDG